MSSVMTKTMLGRSMLPAAAVAGDPEAACTADLMVVTSSANVTPDAASNKTISAVVPLRTQACIVSLESPRPEGTA
jgi:hypothetical protein